MTFLMDMLSFAFIRRALLVGIFVSLCAASWGESGSEAILDDWRWIITRFFRGFIRCIGVRLGNG